MKLFTFVDGDEPAVGVIPSASETAWNLSELFIDFIDFEEFAANPYSLQTIIAAYAVEELALLIGNCINKVEASGKAEAYQVDFAHIEVLAPLKPNNNVIAFGKNYAKHIEEMQSEQILYVFTKSLTSVVGHKVTIPNHQDITKELDYEGELAIVIGQPAYKVSQADAYDYVFGYTIVNDISARNLQREHEQAFLAKSLPGSCPVGPVVVTVDELFNPENTPIVTKVNGEIRQNGNTKDMIMKIPAIIEELSKYIVLEPGDIIATGTPAGVAAGMHDPAAFLQPGDEVSITIEPIGTLTTRIGE